MICFANAGLPSYAAGAIRQFILDSDETVRVIGTIPNIPQTCDDVLAGVQVHWILNDDPRSVREVIGAMPDVLVVSGWFRPALNHFAAEVRQAGGIVVALSDNRYESFFYSFLWTVYFRSQVAGRFHAYMVPGRSGERLLRLAGVRRDCFRIGMYTADPAIYHGGTALEYRERRMAFVGRFCEQKNVLLMVKTFLAFAKRHADWVLDCYGQGELQGQMEALIQASGEQVVHIHPFLQPVQLAEVYRQTRVLILPSIDDHWGVVVHEAALSGCALLLSSQVGAAADLGQGPNCMTFNPGSGSQFFNCLERFAGWQDNQWQEAQKESQAVAARFSPKIFSKNLHDLIQTCRCAKQLQGSRVGRMH